MSGPIRVITLLLLCLPALPTQADLTGVNEITVREIRLSGASLLTDEEASTVTAPLTNRQVGFEELLAARKALTALVVEKGYVSSGVVLPEQEVLDGIVEFVVVSNELTDLRIEGAQGLRDEYIANIVRSRVSGPLNVADLNASIRDVERLGLVSSVNGRLIPGANSGESTLSLFVSEVPRRSITVSGDNYRSPGVGEHQATVAVTHDSLTGRDDSLRFALDFGDGSEDYFGSYEFAVNRHGTRLNTYLVQQNLDIVENPFDDLDIETDTDAWGFSLSHDLLTRLDRSARLFFGFENEHTKSELLGERFSFSLGEEQGKSETSSLTFGLEWAQRIGEQRFALRGTVKQGLRWLGATQNDEGLPESEFTAFIGQAQVIRDLDLFGGSQLNLRLVFQVSDDPLLPQHKLPVGGRYSVRGYRENQYVRDNGMATNLELAIPLVEFQGTLTLIPFLDYGGAEDKLSQLPSSNYDYLFSGGLGLEWLSRIEGLRAEIYYGHDFEDVDNPTKSDQERGFHYQVSFSRRF